MVKLWADKNLIITYNASGAAKAAQLGYTVIIVDVIDMSTSLEAALQSGAAFVFGASPDLTRAPVQVNPYNIGLMAGNKAKEIKSEIIIITEPRLSAKRKKIENCRQVIRGVKETGSPILDILPNIGAEVARQTDFKNKIVICVSDTGGVAFDAAWQFHNKVTIGTIARTLFTRGKESTNIAAHRVIELAANKGIAVVAASSNSQEDILGANYIAQAIIDSGYLNI